MKKPDLTKLTYRQLKKLRTKARHVAREYTGKTMGRAVELAQDADMEMYVREKDGRIKSSRRRRKNPANPRMQNMFVLIATRGKTVLKYVGGVRFSSKGRAVLFPSRSDANAAARDLKSRFSDSLRGYTLRVQS